jgi:hypothetical protein
VLVHALSSSQGSLIAVHNFSPEPQTVEFSLPEGMGPKAELVELLRDGGLVADEKGRVSMALDAYDYKWLRVHDSNDKRLT